MGMVASCAIIGGATFALFTDSASVAPTAQDVMVAGNVDIDSYRDGFDTIPGPMFYTTPEEGATPTEPSFKGLKPTGVWAPGDTKIRSLIVYNKGSLDAVLSHVYAQIDTDPTNMAKHMTVQVYQILPQCLPDGTPFAAIPGDDTLNQDLLNYTSQLINPLILMTDAFFGVEDDVQAIIEREAKVRANRIYSGPLSTLRQGFQPLTKGIDMAANDIDFAKRGCLIAFVVKLNKNADNLHQDADMIINFHVKASQQANMLD